MPEKNTNRNGHKQLSPKWLPPDLYDYVIESKDREGLSQTAVLVRALGLDKFKQEFAEMINLARCSKCGRKSILLNGNNLCVVCVFGLGAEKESRIFREAGGELADPEIIAGSSFSYMFKGKPICLKCDKPVDMFGPIYVIEYGATRFIFAKCHGEVEVRSANEFLIKDGTPDTKEFLSDFFKAGK